MMEFRKDQQLLRMPSKDDYHIMKWAENLAEPNDKVRDEFFRILKDIATIMMKEVVDNKGMFYHGPISRADVKTRVGMQLLDITPFNKLGASSQIWMDGSSSVLTMPMMMSRLNLYFWKRYETFVM